MMRPVAAALRRSANKAKQVAPAPDILAGLAPGTWDNLSSTTAIAGATRVAASSRSSPLSERDCRAAAASDPSAGDDRAEDSNFDPGVSPSAAKTLGVGASTWGLTRTAKIFGSAI